MVKRYGATNDKTVDAQILVIVKWYKKVTHAHIQGLGSREALDKQVEVVNTYACY